MGAISHGGDPCPFWIIRRRRAASTLCPFIPQQRTCCDSLDPIESNVGLSQFQKSALLSTRQPHSPMRLCKPAPTEAAHDGLRFWCLISEGTPSSFEQPGPPAKRAKLSIGGGAEQAKAAVSRG